jgi:hypothetical protein
MDLPHGLRVNADSFVATALGPRDNLWLKQIEEKALDHVLDFYPWWKKEQDVLYYQGMALTLAWNLIVWREPRTDEEEDVMRQFMMACREAAALDPEVDLPRGLWKNCCLWLKEEIPQAAEGPDRIGELGYRQGLIHFPVGALWSVCLPGIFSQEKPAGPGTWRAWNEDRRVETRLARVAKVAPVEEILPRFKEKSPCERLTVRQKELEFYGVGDLGRSEEGQTVLQAEYLCGDSVLALQVVGGENDRDWVIGVWESVRRA